MQVTSVSPRMLPLLLSLVLPSSALSSEPAVQEPQTAGVATAGTDEPVLPPRRDYGPAEAIVPESPESVVSELTLAKLGVAGTPNVGPFRLVLEKLAELSNEPRAYAGYVESLSEWVGLVVQDPGLYTYAEREAALQVALVLDGRDDAAEASGRETGQARVDAAVRMLSSNTPSDVFSLSQKRLVELTRGLQRHATPLDERYRSIGQEEGGLPATDVDRVDWRFIFENLLLNFDNGPTRFLYREVSAGTSGAVEGGDLSRVWEVTESSYGVLRFSSGPLPSDPFVEFAPDVVESCLRGGTLSQQLAAAITTGKRATEDLNRLDKFDLGKNSTAYITVAPRSFDAMVVSALPQGVLLLSELEKRYGDAGSVLIRDDDPMRSVRIALREMRDREDPPSHVVVYVASHGDESGLFFPGAHGQPVTVTYNDLWDLQEISRGSQLVCILTACRGGGMLHQAEIAPADRIHSDAARPVIVCMEGPGTDNFYSDAGAPSLYGLIAALHQGGGGSKFGSALRLVRDWLPGRGIADPFVVIGVGD